MQEERKALARVAKERKEGSLAVHRLRWRWNLRRATCGHVCGQLLYPGDSPALTTRNRELKEEEQREENRRKLSRECRKCSYACSEDVIKRLRRGKKKAQKQAERRIRSVSSSDNEVSREEGKDEEGRDAADGVLAGLSSMACFAEGLQCDCPKVSQLHASSGCRTSECENASSGAEEHEDEESSIPASRVDVSLFHVRERYAF